MFRIPGRTTCSLKPEFCCYNALVQIENSKIFKKHEKHADKYTDKYLAQKSWIQWKLHPKLKDFQEHK